MSCSDASSIGNLDILHDSHCRAIGGVDGVGRLTVNRAASQVHKLRHTQPKQFALGHLPQVSTGQPGVALCSAKRMAPILSRSTISMAAWRNRGIDVDQLGGYAGGGARTRTAMGQGILSALCLPIPSRPRLRNGITGASALLKLPPGRDMGMFLRQAGNGL